MEKSLMKVKILLSMAFFLCVMSFASQKMNVKAAIVSTNHQKYTYGELKADLKKLEKKYGEYCQVNVIGQSADDRNLYEVVLGNQEAKKHLLVIGNLHAREYMTTQLCMRQIEYYLDSYDKKIGGKKVSKALDKIAVHYVPSCNPDGTAISQFGFKAIKNESLRRQLYKMSGSTSRWKANARGVDLNRNWNVAFSPGGRRGGAGYHGTRASSEPEIKALVKWVNNIEDSGKIKGIVSYHSTGSILYGRCGGGVNAKVRKETARMTGLARRLTGYGLMPASGLRASGGNSREYFLYKKNIPCITLEIGRGACPLGIGEFSSIWRKNKDVVIKEAMLFD